MDLPPLQFPLIYRRQRSFFKAMLMSLIAANLAGGKAKTETPKAIIEIRPPTYAPLDTFAPGRPPAHVTLDPKLEAGLCVWSWTAYISTETHRPRFAYKTVLAEITSVHLTTNLAIQLWLVEKAGSDVLPHEKTHQAICEYYYSRSEEVARKMVLPLIGKKISLPTKNANAALEEAGKKITDDFHREFTRRAQDRCEFAQERFDTITQHGQNPIQNSVAMIQAIAEENDHWQTIRGDSP